MTALDEAAREIAEQAGSLACQSRRSLAIDRIAAILRRHLAPPGDAEAAAQKRLDEITPTAEEWKEIVAESVVPPEVYAAQPRERELELPVTEELLRKRGYSDDGLRGWTKLIPPVNDKAAIVTLHIEPPQPELDEAIASAAGYKCERRGDWSASLTQGMPDEGHYRDDLISLTGLPGRLTVGHLLRLESALGIPQPAARPQEQP